MVKTDLKDSNYEPEKSSVLQESKIFHESPVDSRKCADILANILYMINRGEVLGGKEATECFFAITKLFHRFKKLKKCRVDLTLPESDEDQNSSKWLEFVKEIFKDSVDFKFSFIYNKQIQDEKKRAEIYCKSAMTVFLIKIIF